MTPHDMCLLQDVKSLIYGNPSDNKWIATADAQLSAYITMASRAVLTMLTRPAIIAHNVNEIRSGLGGATFMLKEYPLLGDVASLFIDGLPSPQRTTVAGQRAGQQGKGFVVTNPWDGYGPGSPAVLAGACFTRGDANIEVNYVAGYAVVSEPATVPVAAPYTIAPQAPQGRYAGDISVIYNNAALTPLTPVANSVVQGQYIPPQFPTAALNNSFTPVYTFAAADANKPVFLSYSFTPADIAYAVQKWIAEWWAYKGRVGQKSTAMSGGAGTASFDLSDMPADVKMILNVYKSVALL